MSSFSALDPPPPRHPEMDPDVVRRAWARRVEAASVARRAGTVVWGIAFAGALLLPPWWPFHSMLALGLLGLAVAAAWVAVNLVYGRCPRCGEDPSPEHPRQAVPLRYRRTRFPMELYETCANCGVALR